MRIFHLLNHTRRLNGHVHAALDLACAQAAKGHQVSMLSGGGDFEELLARHSIEVIPLDQERRPLTMAKALVALRRFAKDKRPDIVHAHMMTSAVLAWPVCKLLRIPLVTTVHNEFERSSILMGLGTRVIAVSAAVARSLEKRGVAAKRIDVVLNGTIGAARLEGRPQTVRALESPSIVFVGGLHPRKGLPDLLRAFDAVWSKNARTRLYVVGGGPFQAQYECDAAALPCAVAVAFLGPQDDPFPWMRGADIFCLPSLADPAPLVLPEAREAGCAIVATAVGGIPELLDDGAAGILVPPGQPMRLAEAILCLVEHPEELARWKARSAANLSRMCVARVEEETMRVYEAAAATGRRPQRHASSDASLRE